MSLADTFQHSGIPVLASCLPVWTCWLCSPSSASISNVYMLCFSGPYILWWGRPPKWLCSQVMPLMPSLQGPSFLPWFYSMQPEKGIRSLHWAQIPGNTLAPTPKWKGIHAEWSLGQLLCSVLWEAFWSSSRAWICFEALFIQVWPMDRQHEHPWVSLECRKAGSSPDLWNQSRHLNKIPRWSMCTLKLDKHFFLEC